MRAVLESLEFRELLIADVALMRGVASARDVAYALQGYWERRDEAGVSIIAELAKAPGISEDGLKPVIEEVARLISEADGDARLALTRHGGLDRSIAAALG
ncbi:MAG: hypothetical protein ACYTG6_17535, partial [Planctomycetota bacterium]